MKILVVDDDDFIRELVVDSLKKEPDFEIYTATNAQEALERWSTIQPDILITDMMMPAMNGAELIRTLRDSNTPCEIIIMTGYADLDMAIEVIKFNVFELIKKPFQPNMLRLILNKACEKIKIKKENIQLKAQLVQAEKLSAIGLLSAGVAHEINNPNAFIRTNAEWLESCLTDLTSCIDSAISQSTPETATAYRLLRDQLHEPIIAIIEGSKRIQKIVSSLLSFSHHSLGEQRAVALSELLDTALTLTRHRTKDCVIAISIPDLLPPLWVNEQDTVQMFMNFLVNAIDSMEETPPENRKIEISAIHTAPHRVAITFRDYGCGIPPELLPLIYDPFFTTKPLGKGTGLGLSIIMGQLKANHGDLTCESAVGQGTTFTVTLPVAVG